MGDLVEWVWRGGFAVRFVMHRVMVFGVMAAAALGGWVDETAYVHETVRGPVPDLIRLDVPEALENRALAELGLVDVTAAPFGADARGMKDSTEAIQGAVDFARDHQMVCFFPAGTYKVSDTIRCTQGFYRRQNGRISGSGNFPCVLVGSREGAQRPRIVLTDNAAGFGDLDKPKYVVYFWARSVDEGAEKPQPNISFNQMFVGIDVVLGKGNAGAVGIRHRAAQGSGVQDCTIDATGGLAGLEGGAGSGGSHAGITVIGGRIGMDLRQTQPAPTITGVTLIGQTGPAILNDSRQALCAVGVKIVRTGPGAAIVGGAGWNVHFQGQVVLVDSEVAFELPDAGNVVIEAQRSFYFHNVYVKNAAVLARLPKGEQVGGRAQGWLRVEQLAQPVGMPAYKGRQYVCPVFVDGVKLPGALVRAAEVDGPPADLCSRHLWDAGLAGWEEALRGQAACATNVKAAPYGAKGEGVSDDTEALQRAVDENAVVFLPKGIYRVSRTLRLGAKTKVVGVGKAFSVIAVRGDEGFFTDAKQPRPVIQTADAADAETVMSFCGVYVPREVPGAYALQWRAGARSFVRDVQLLLMPGVGYGKRGPDHAPRTSPLVVVTGNGGGRWYNFELGVGQASPGYRHILIDGTHEKLAFYQCCPEGVRSEANMEIRNSRNVSIYGFKGEGNTYMVWMKDSADVRVFGYGGNASGRPEDTLFRVERCEDFLLAGMVDHPMEQGHAAIRGAVGTDPERWHMVIETTEAGETVRTGSLVRPILYQRGG